MRRPFIPPIACPTCGQVDHGGIVPRGWVIICSLCNRKGPQQQLAKTHQQISVDEPVLSE
jgi:hypothetical protein